MPTPSEELALLILTQAEWLPAGGLTASSAGDFFVQMAIDIGRQREEDRIARLFGPSPGKRRAALRGQH